MSMNLIDIIIVVLVLAAIRRGIRIGLLRLVLSAAGLLGGLLIGSALAGVLSPHIDDGVWRFYAAIAIALSVGALFSGLGDKLGSYLADKATRLHLEKFNTVLGSVFEVAFTLGAAWLLASVLSNSTAGNVGAQIRNSEVITRMNAILPAPPDVLAELERALTDNGFPKVFVGNEPDQKPVNTNVTLDRAVVDKAQQSVVRIEGRGCGGIVEGSGFVGKPSMVVTNAHVVAGIKAPYILLNNKTYTATTVYFNKDLDLAILSVKGLEAPVMPLSTAIAASNTPIAAMGFPGGGPLTVSGGAIIDNISAVGRNIYDRGLVAREIYQVAAQIRQGNSGGPIIDGKGNAIGVVFAKSVTNDSVGYALLANQVSGPLNSVSGTSPAVNTNRCAS